jgi:hypothetical protein
MKKASIIAALLQSSSSVVPICANPSKPFDKIEAGGRQRRLRIRQLDESRHNDFDIEDRDVFDLLVADAQASAEAHDATPSPLVSNAGKPTDAPAVSWTNLYIPAVPSNRQLDFPTETPSVSWLKFPSVSPSSASLVFVTPAPTTPTRPELTTPATINGTPVIDAKVPITSPPVTPGAVTVSPVTPAPTTRSPTSSTTSVRVTGAPSTTNPSASPVHVVTPSSAPSIEPSQYPSLQPVRITIAPTTTAPTANPVSLIPTVSPVVETVGPTPGMITQGPSTRAPVTAVPTPLTAAPAVAAPIVPAANFSTMAPTAVNTSGSASPVQPVNQSEAIKTTCTLDAQGHYGTDLGFANQLKYVYELTVTLQTDATVLKSAILPEIEKQITFLLLPLLFPSSCGISLTRIGDERRIVELAELSGLSGSPWDYAVDGVNCNSEATEGNVCYVIDGAATLFTNDRQNMTETLALGEETIAKAMKEGAFTAFAGFVGVRPREKLIMTTNATDSGAGETSEMNAKKLPIWAYIFVVGGILMCGFMVYCCYVIPLRRDSSPWDETVDADPNDPTSYDSPHVANMDDSWVANNPPVRQGIGMEESFTEASYRSVPASGDNNSYTASRASGSRASESRYSSDHTRDTRETRGSMKSRKSRVDDEFDRVYLQNGGNEAELSEEGRPRAGRATHNLYRQQYGSDVGSRRPPNDDDDHDKPFLAPMLPVGSGPRRSPSIDMAPMNTSNQDRFDAFGFGQGMGMEPVDEDGFGVFDSGNGVGNQR